MSDEYTSDPENVRLRALLEADIFAVDHDPLFDEVASLASDMLGMPIALVTTLDGARQYHVGRVGLDLPSLEFEHSFCAHAIVMDTPMVVHDATSDVRFADNPYVTGEPHIRFYAGAPIVTNDGTAVGAVCVIDRQPRDIDDRGLRVLRLLALTVSRDIDLRRQHQRIRELVHQVHDHAAALERVTDTAMRLLSVIAHDIRGPLTSIATLLSDQDLMSSASEDLPWILEEIRSQATVGRDLLDQILSWARTMLRGGPTLMQDVDLALIVDEVIRIHREHAERKGTRITVEHGVERCDIDPNLIRFFVHTLVSNAVKFTEGGRITVRTRHEPTGIVIEVKDTGLGMPPNVRMRLFDWSRRGGLPGTRREKGAGLGLLLVKDFLDMIGGTISIVSAPNDGTTITITIPPQRTSS